MADDNNNFFERIMELGIGINMAQRMPDMLSQCLPGGQQNVSQAPPHIPHEDNSFYVVVDNAQAGPFSTDDLLLLIRKNILLKDTLVWKKGMPQWTQASNVPELNKLFLLSKM